MKDRKPDKQLQYESHQCDQENNTCHQIHDVSIMVHKKKVENRKKVDLVKCGQQPADAFRLSRSSRNKKRKFLTTHNSMTEIKKRTKLSKQFTRSIDAIQKKSLFFSKFVVNRVSDYHLNDFLSSFNYPTQRKWKVYRCQISAPMDSCCCSCNSDAMFEVMKGLYDCYKMKNCDNCTCVLCSHKLHEKRRLGEERKSLAALDAKAKKSKVKEAEKMIKGKTTAEKEDFFKELAKTGQPLPKGKTASERALIKIVKQEMGAPVSKTTTMLEKNKKSKAAQITPSQKIKKSRASGLITPLEGKTHEQKEKILKGLAMQGLPLPEGKTASEKKISEKVRTELGFPPEPKTASMKEKYEKAATAGLLQPLEGKTKSEKEKILTSLQEKGIPLPEGRTSSEKAIIAKVKTETRVVSATPSAKLAKAKAAGLLTPLEGKTPSQKEKIVKDLAMQGLPFPEVKTASEKKLIDKVRVDLGLPPEPKTLFMKEKYEKAATAGLLQPLEGKTKSEKEKILTSLQEKGIPLPEGRTSSEKAIIAKVKTETRAVSATPSAKLAKAKAVGLLTPLEGKTPLQKEKIVKGLAMQGLPFPEVKTASEKKLIDKVRVDLGLPPEPKTLFMKEKYKKAATAGFLQPLEGKTTSEKEKILKSLQEKGIPLPEGRTSSEKAIIAKVKTETRAVSATPSAKLAKAKAVGLLTPLEGKTPSQKEKIVKGLAMQGLPFPEVKTASEKKLIDKVRVDLGLPPEPKTLFMKEKYEKVATAGLLQPLEGKTTTEKEKILKSLQEKGIPLPEGRTSSEKAIIAKVKTETRAVSATPSAKLAKAKAAGLLTPLEGKTPSQKEKILKFLAKEGLPLPEAKTASEKKISEKVRTELGLPPEPKTLSMREKFEKAASAGLLYRLEGKSPSEKEKILKSLQDKGIPLPEGRTASEKPIVAKIKASVRAPSVKLSRTPIAAGFGARPLLPEERRKLDEKTAKKQKEGKGPVDECICGLLTPEPEKEIPKPVKEPSTKARAPSVTTDKLKKAKAAGILTPLEGKTSEQKEKILKGLAESGLPLPRGKTASEKTMIKKIKTEFGVPEMTTSEKIKKAKKSGLLSPFEGKTPSQKEKILRGRAAAGLPLPVGTTPSDRALIQKIQEDTGYVSPTQSERIKRAKDAGLLTPIEGKSASAKEKILRDRVAAGVPLPEGATPSEKEIIRKISAGEQPAVMRLSEKLKEAKTASEKEKILRSLRKAGKPLPEETTPSEKELIAKLKAESKAIKFGVPEKIKKAKESGMLTTFQGKTPSQKEKILRGRAEAGFPLSVGKTLSDRALIQKIEEDTGYVSPTKSERLKRAKDAGLLTPIEGKSPSAKEKILRDRVAAGLSLPESATPSEKEIVRKISAEEPPAVIHLSEKLKEAKTASEKEKILRSLRIAGKSLHEGTTPSEKELIAKVKAESKVLSKVTSEKLQKARAAGLLTPLTGKPSKEKERILKGLIEKGLPLPESQTESEKKIATKVRKELGLPFEPKTVSEKSKMRKAEAAGIVTPLEGKTPSQKEHILKGMATAGIPLPEGRTASEKTVIKKIKAEEGKLLLKEAVSLKGTTLSQKEKAVRSLAAAGKPLPEGKTPSEKALVQKVRAELGMLPPAKTISEKEVVRKAKEEGLLTPIAGKSAKEKVRILEGLAEAGLPLPEGKTASEKELVKKVRAEAGLPPEPTPSEKRGEIKTKSKKSGISTSKQRVTTKAAGISEKLEEVVKTRTCDRGCGCDKKKIKFKHSYIKIRVTSPDISSCCDCPYECLPGVKAGAFIDNEGIKVTIGRVHGVTSFTSQTSNRSLETYNNVITLYGKTLTDSYSSNTSTDIVDALSVNTSEATHLKKSFFDACPFLRSPINVDKLNTEVNPSCSYTSGSYDRYTNSKFYTDSSKSNNLFECSSYKNYSDESDRLVDSFRKTSSFHECSVSYDSIFRTKSESSLSLITESGDSIDVTSVLSLCSSSYNTSNSIQYLYNPVSTDYLSDSLGETQLSLHYSNNDDSGNDGTEDSGDDTMMSTEDSMAQFKSPRNSTLGTDSTKRKQNEYFTYLLPQTKLDSKIVARQITDNGNPIVVMNNMDSELDITALVNQLLSKKEFCDTSSIFVVVPTSDIDSELESDSSTICIQLSRHQPNWSRKQCNIVEPSIPTRKILSNTRGLKISSKGKLYCMEGIQQRVASFHNKETMFHSRIPKFCSHKAEEKKRKNKLCQITTPDETISLYRSIKTDTTSDRPCCCPLRLEESRTYEYGCVAHVVSELITPVLENQVSGINYYDYSRLGKMNVIQQASFVSINGGLTSVTPCVISPCRGNPGCHPGHMFPYDTTILTPFCGPKHSQMSEDICNPKSSYMLDLESKPVSNCRDEKQSELCQCSPEKIKEMIEQALKGNASNYETTGSAMDNPPTQQPTQPPTKAPAKPPTNQAASNKHQPKYIKPAFKPLCSSGNDEDVCGNYPNQNINENVKCACSGRERTVKIGSLCPCEQYPPPVSMITFGPKVMGTRSMGCQCCCCEDSMVQAASESKLLGPTGGMCQMEPGGTSCQVGRKPKALDLKQIGSNCACAVDGKNNKNVICECPSEPKPEPETEPDEYLPSAKHSLYQTDQLVERNQVLRQNSDITQTQSGFRLFKKKKRPPPPEPEFTVEDAVKYYVAINPDLLKDLCPKPSEPKEYPCKEENLAAKKSRKFIFSRFSKVQCERPAPPPTSASKRVPSKSAHSKGAPPPEPEPEPKPENEAPSGGIKLSIGGKGSGSKGLSSVCCFNMIQETNISRTKQSK